MSAQQQDWYLYIIETEQGQLYTGITTDVDRRFQQHLAVSSGQAKAKGAKYFRTQTPKRVIHLEVFSDRATASRREIAVKKMSKQQKLTLLNSLSH